MKIYVYSSATWLEKGWVKIGETTKTVESRVRHQDNESCPEPLEILYEEDVGGIITDRSVHRVLEHKRVRKEWFEATVEEVKQAIKDAKKMAINATPFEKPTDNQKELLKNKYSEELGMSSLVGGMGSYENVGRAVGETLKSMHKHSLEESWALIWPNSKRFLERRVTLEDDWRWTQELGLTLVWVSPEDYMSIQQEEKIK